jgi:hypothetical protein
MKRVVSHEAVTAAGLCYTAALAAWAVRYSPTAASVPAGLLLAAVLPGWALSTALLHRTRISTVERLVLVPALSLAVLVLGGLSMYTAGVKLDRASWTALTVGVTLVAAPVGYLRVRRRAGAEAAARIQARLRVVARAAVPLAVAAALLVGAGWLSMRSALAQDDKPVTALSAVVTGTDPAGRRTVLIDVTDGEPGQTTFDVRVTGPDGYRSEVDVPLARGRHWSHTVDVPPGTVTIGLFRAGDASAYRSAFLEESP